MKSIKEWREFRDDEDFLSGYTKKIRKQKELTKTISRQIKKKRKESIFSNWNNL